MVLLYQNIHKFARIQAPPRVLPKPALTPDQVIEKIEKETGHQFDPLLVNHLLDLIREKKLLDLPKERIRTAKKGI